MNTFHWLKRKTWGLSILTAALTLSATASAALPGSAELKQRELADGLYEMVYSPKQTRCTLRAHRVSKTSTAGCSINWIPQRLPRKVKPTPT